MLHNDSQKMRVFLVLLVYLVTSSAFAANNLGCRDDNGDLVDWFYLYKIPSNENFNGNVLNTHSEDSGYNYLYITSSSTNKNWMLSKKLMNESSSASGHTLSESVYGNSKNLVVLYNDQPPNSNGLESRGHSKGVLVSDGEKGFWIIHSIPHFPPSLEASNIYDYPKTGRIYGQSFLCISLNDDQIDIVGKQLTYNEVQVYSSQVPDSFKYGLF